MKVVVVGGTGFLGSRTAEALRKLEGVEVRVGGRKSADVRIDLRDPSTFEALRGSDVVVDFAGTCERSPEALAKFCIENGIVMLEGTSERPLVEALHRALGDAKGTGALVLGAGIFTGMSNLLARDAKESVRDCRSLELGIASHPYSGGGQGTVDLMVAALNTDYVSYVNGELRRGPPVSAGPVLPFPDGDAPSLAAPIAEQSMLPHSLRIPDVAVYLSPRPVLLQWMFRSLPAGILRSGFFRGYMRMMFSVIRRWILRARISPVRDGRGRTWIVGHGDPHAPH